MPTDQRNELQRGRLISLVERLRNLDSDYWRAKLSDVDPRSVAVGDMTALPFTTKAELRDAYPFGMLAVPLSETVRIHASSGTQGKPTIVAYTAADIDLFSEVVARSIEAAGGVPSDVIQVAYGYGLFTGGLGLQYGGERLGATVIPASGGNPGTAGRAVGQSGRFGSVLHSFLCHALGRTSAG